MSDHTSDRFEYVVEGSHPRLGSPIYEARGSWLRNNKYLGLFVIGTLIAGVLAIGATSGIDWQALMQGKADEETWGKLMAAGFFGLIAFGLFLPILWAIEGSTTIVWIYDRGLAKQTFLTKREILWDDITTVQEMHNLLFRHGERISSYHSIKLRLASGRKVKLDLSHIEGSETISAMIAENTLGRLTAEAMDRLEREGRVRFGPLTVTKDQLRYERLLWTSRIGWGQIRKVDIDNGILIIKTGEEWYGSWCHHAVALIPDFRVLLVLIEQMSNGPMGGGQFDDVCNRFRETGSMLASWTADR